MRRLRAQVDVLGRQESDGFLRQYPLVCDVFLDFVHGCLICCSWSAPVLELMALTSARMRHLARDVESIDRRHLPSFRLVPLCE